MGIIVKRARFVVNVNDNNLYAYCATTTFSLGHREETQLVPKADYNFSWGLTFFF